MLLKNNKCNMVIERSEKYSGVIREVWKLGAKGKMMNKFSSQASHTDAIDGFSSDGWYAQPGCSICSSSIGYSNLANQSRCEQALVAKLVESDDLAYAVGQRLMPVLTGVGEYIYPLLTNAYISPVAMDQYEFSVFQQRLKHLLHRMGLTQYRWGKNPLIRCHEYASDEMSLANAIVIELRKYLLSRGYKADLASRKKISEKQLSAINSLLKKLLTSTDGALIRRFDFYDNTGMVPVSVEESNTRWSKFLKKLALWMIENSHLGYVWRKEFIPEVGFRYHLILCCHIDSARGGPVECTLLPMWQESTMNAHAYILQPLGHRWGGNNEIASRHAPEVLIKVVDSIRMMLDGERICRLRSVNGMPNWGSQDLRGMQKKQMADGDHHG